MQGTFLGGRSGFSFYLLFLCVPCPFAVLLRGQGEPTLGLTTKEPNVASSPSPSRPSADTGRGCRGSLWAGQEQDGMSYNLPWRKGQQGGKALNRSQERRGEKVQTLSPETGEGWEPASRGSDPERGGKNGHRANRLYLWEGEVPAGVQDLSGAPTEILKGEVSTG